MTEKQTATTFKSLQFLRHMHKVPIFISQCLAFLATTFTNYGKGNWKLRRFHESGYTPAGKVSDSNHMAM